MRFDIVTVSISINNLMLRLFVLLIRSVSYYLFRNLKG